MTDSNLHCYFGMVQCCHSDLMRLMDELEEKPLEPDLEAFVLQTNAAAATAAD